MHKSALSATFVRSIKEPGKYHDGAGTGLFLLVKPNGSRFWVQRIVIRGKRRELGLGGYPTVSLADARTEALENKRITRSGDDPSAKKKKAAVYSQFRGSRPRRTCRAVIRMEEPKRPGGLFEQSGKVHFPSLW